VALAAGVAIAQTPSTSNPDYNNTPSSNSATTADQNSSSTSSNTVNPSNDQNPSATSAGMYSSDTAATTDYSQAGERG
jgi:hypothetical protein